MSQVNGLNRGLRSQVWTTPPDLFAKLDAEFHFTLDAAASIGNNLCPDFYTTEADALLQPWRGRVFCNPPFRDCDAFVRYGHQQVVAGVSEVVVMLVPVRGDVGWWHDVALSKECEIRWIRGRLRFGGSKINAPFACCVLVLRRSQ